MKNKSVIIIVMLLLVSISGFSQFSVQYKCAETNTSTNQIKPHVNILNVSGGSVSLSSLTLRYYYTKEGSAGEEFHVDYAVIGSGNVTGSIGSGYAEVTFTSGAGSFSSGQQTGEIQLRINKTDWSTYDQSDDWSFDPTITAYTEYTRIALFLNGNLVWGEEPGTPTPTPVETDPPTPAPTTGDNMYKDRFIELWNEIHDPGNGYFSPAGAPYHCDKTVVCEAPDHGHASTSEAYSYYIWLEVAYGRATGDWSYLDNAWSIVESQIIPSVQTGNGKYDPSSPATYAAEWDLPDDYPSELMFDLPVGSDPISNGLRSAYGDSIYGMHWLLDCDDFYGYGGSSWNGKPVFINTFQRGCQESVYETIPHPSIERFEWGGPNGFLDLFTIDQSYAQQWRYTTAPDAEARIVQAMYWAKEAGYNGAGISKASKMGDFTRLSFFDKYFKPIAANTTESSSGSGYDSCHYLISWYYAWGGGIDGNWAWRIGCSHCHFGYQNPVAAWVMANDSAFAGKAQNCTADWAESLERQIEFYQWLQSADGLFGGGATNSWLGRYASYPSGKATFHGMAYDQDPVYEDPGSNEWFGMQCWSGERLCEYYYLTGDSRAKTMLDKWFDWINENVILETDGNYRIPCTLVWSGEPDTWNGSPGSNSSLRVRLASDAEWDGRNTSVDVGGSLAKALVYYAAGTQLHATLNEDAKNLAQELLDRMWNVYRDEAGLGVPEEPWFLERWMTENVYVPSGWRGTMPNGDVIQPGITFQDIRTGFQNDSLGQQLINMYNTGNLEAYTTHRFWGEVDCATAYLAYSELFGDEPTTPTTPPADTPTPTTPPADTPTPTNPPAAGVGDVWFVPNASTAKVNTDFQVEVHVNSGTVILAAYGFEIAFTSGLIGVNTEIGNSGVEAGPDGFVAAVNPNEPGVLVLSGFDTTGTGPGTDLHVVTINFTAGSTTGSTTLGLTVDNLVDTNTEVIGVPNGIPGSVEVVDVTMGDVNDNGVVDIVDALLIAQYYVGINDTINTAAADVNCDGAINIVDALLVAQFYVGIITEFPC